MRSMTVRRYGFAAALVLMTPLGLDAQPEAEWAAVEQAIGFKGAVQPGGGSAWACREATSTSRSRASG